jgi:hypothetical protein
LNAISFYSDVIELKYFQEEYPIFAVGSYDNGSKLNISASSSGTAYEVLSGNENVLVADIEGRIKAVGDGTDVVRVWNSGLSADLLVKVNITNRKPILNPLGTIITREGQVSMVALSSADIDGNVLRLTVDAPRFVQLIDNGDGTGQLLVKPSDGDSGVYNVRVSVLDNGEPVLGDTKSFTLTVAKAMPTVTIKALDSKATEPGKDKGKIRVTRTGDTSKPLTVYYKVGGKAKNGVDYKKLSGSLTIPIGKTSANLSVKPIDDRSKELRESIKLTLLKKASYIVGTPSSTTITIDDND